MPLALADRVEQFEAALAADPAADLARFLPPAGDPDHAAVLAELIRVDLEGSWSRGAGRRVADYPRRGPAPPCPSRAPSSSASSWTRSWGGGRSAGCTWPGRRT